MVHLMVTDKTLASWTATVDPSLRPMFLTSFEALKKDTRDERFVSVHEMTRGTQNKHLEAHQT